MRRSATALVAAVVLLHTGAAPAADVMLKQKVTTAGVPKPGTTEETLWWTDTKRITDGADTRMIIDLAAKTMTLAEKDTRSYSVVTFDRIRAQTEQLQKMKDQLPPEVQKQMAALDQDITVESTGRTEQLLGHTAKEFRVSGGLAQGTVWVAEDAPTPGNLDEWREAMSAMGGSHGPGNKLAAAMGKLKGLPLKSTFTTAMGDRKFTATTEVTQIAEKSPPADVLVPPAGFTEKPMDVGGHGAPPRRK